MKTYIGWLNESLEKKYFKEDLDHDFLSYENRMTREEFDNCIQADPTYPSAHGRDSKGAYGDWVLKIYSNFKKNNPEGAYFDFAHCRDVLSRYRDASNKHRIKDNKRKDISSFKTLEDLDDFVRDVNGGNLVPTTTNQREKERQKRVHNTNPEDEADLIVDNDRCQVWIPRTYEADAKLGRGTKWCTASSGGEGYFEEYTRFVPLYVLIMKDNPDEKYQFCAYQDSAMDKNDEPVHLWNFPEVADLVNKDSEVLYEKTIGLFNRIKQLGPKRVSYDELNDIIIVADNLKDYVNCDDETKESYLALVAGIFCEKLKGDNEKADERTVTVVLNSASDLTDAVDFGINDSDEAEDMEDEISDACSDWQERQRSLGGMISEP